MAGLAEVLEIIRMSAWPAADRRRLAARAVAAELPLRRQTPAAAAAAGEVQPPPGASGNGQTDAAALYLMEEALAAVGRLAGLPPGQRLRIAEAKAVLRAAHGAVGGSVASRLSRMSKGRNALAHPDVGLLAAIAVLGEHGSSDEGSDSPPGGCAAEQ